jgi:hypothetical protein
VSSHFDSENDIILWGPSIPFGAQSLRFCSKLQTGHIERQMMHDKLR